MNGIPGLVISDWGAVNNRISGIQAGMDLEMPGLSRENDIILASAVRNGTLAEVALDRCAERVITLILKAQKRENLEDKREEHHFLAQRAARESAVLLKNEDQLLPGNTSQSAAVIGAFAKTPRYQGTGSSKINPHLLENTFE